MGSEDRNNRTRAEDIVEIDVRVAAELNEKFRELVALSQAIPGWTSAADGEGIARDAWALPSNALIIEIGAFLGRCTVLLAGARRLRDSGIVHCVDPFDCSGDAFSVPYYREILASLGGGPLRRHFEDNIARAELTDWVQIHQGRATEIAASWSKPIDLLLLDGDQSPEGARAAYGAWVPFLKPGGTIVLRNTVPRAYAPSHDGHRRLAVEEIVPTTYSDIRQLDDTTIAHKRERRLAPAHRDAPRVHLYAQCWNDAFMLPYFFRHYDPFVDRYVIYDDDSDDLSRDILEKHPKVEIRRFVRSEPEWFVKSEQALSNDCWKESRGSADWVIVTDVDEHLYHPAMLHYLRACADSGVTLIPALGFQMLSESSPGKPDLLCDTLTFGAPYYDLMKVSVFRPDAIEEINFALGRDQVAPVGNVRVPERDELLLLHYKYLGLEQTYARHQALLGRLGKKDFDAEGRWKHPYSWSVDELQDRWRYLAARAVDIRTASGENYPIPRWWLPGMQTVDVASNWINLPMTHEPSPEAKSPFGSSARVVHVADAARYSPLEIEAEPQFFQFRGYDLYLHPPRVGATRLKARDISPVAASPIFTCAVSLDDRSAGPVVFRMRFFDAAQTVWRDAVIQPGERREIKLSLDGFDGPLSAEFTTEMQAGAASNDFAWATFHEPRLTYDQATP
jgi:methyltransferase family protein/glycosyl transferase family 2